jgi:UDP-GlcNAc3NAcA epimerase
MKIVTVLGARPQFIKASAISRIILETPGIKEVLVHTGQHFDTEMSGVFFEQLSLPAPTYHLGVSGLSHGAMTGRMIERIESVIALEKPDWVLVYGDTNSTLAAALAATKVDVAIAHIEAGLRSFNMLMPEEINRILTDRVSTALFCPTSAAVKNLKLEGYPHAVTRTGFQLIENVGDVMLDVAKFYRPAAINVVDIDQFGLRERGYILCTLHRQENVDNESNLTGIFSALQLLARDMRVVMPLHPRTASRLASAKINLDESKIQVLPPLSYLEMQRLEIGAKMILTDSGGVQKEAFFYHVPCITLRQETEWPETLRNGCNIIVGADQHKILEAVRRPVAPAWPKESEFGRGDAAQRIVSMLLSA